MEIIVACPCGQPFSFREEPVNGRLRAPVSCPRCGSDGTRLADDYIAKVQRGEDPFPKSKKSLFNFGLGKPRVSPGEAAQRELQGITEDTVVDRQLPQARLAVGVVAALGVGALGAFGWYAIALKTGIHFGILAWIIGGLVGLACRLAVPNGSFLLATVAGASTFVSILAGHVLVLQVEVDKAIVKGVDRAYEMSLDYARQALKLKTDEDIKFFLADHSAKAMKMHSKAAGSGAPEEKLTATQQRQLYFMNFVLFGLIEREQGLPRLADLKVTGDPSRYTDADVQDFREKEAPELKQLIEGKPSAAAWKGSLSAAIRNQIHFQSLVSGSIGPYTIGWMIFGLITAYKLAHNKSETEDV